MIVDQERLHAEKENFRAKIVWRNVIILSALHLGAIYGLYLLIFQAKWLTCIWSKFDKLFDYYVFVRLYGCNPQAFFFTFSLGWE